MLHLSFYWGLITALNAVVLSLWIGSMFYYCFGLQASLSLLDKTQKTSISLQGLRKLFQFNWINAPIALLCQAALAYHQMAHSQTNGMILSWNAIAALLFVFLLIILQFYNFTGNYQKARRSIRPKQEVFHKINTVIKLSILIGILDIILVNL